MIRFNCAFCGAVIKAPPSAVGRASACPGCKKPITVPSATEVAEPPEIQMGLEPDSSGGAHFEAIPPDPPRHAKKPRVERSLFQEALDELDEEMQSLPDISNSLAQALMVTTKLQAKLLASVPGLPTESDKRQVIGAATETLRTWAIVTGGKANAPIQILGKMLGIGLAIVEGKPETVAELRKARGDGLCFIATASCGPDAPEVVRLRAFRESVLRPTRLGRSFISFYECVSPPIAQVISRSGMARWFVRCFIVRPAALAASIWRT